MNDGPNAFGSYLYRRRIQAGQETIAGFLKHTTIPFTANYYRDVEAGRKVLSLESAVVLHKSLDLSDAESVDYYWHYFKDVLPSDTHEMLFGKRVRIAEGRLRDINALREYDAQLQRKAVVLARYEREFVVDEAVTQSFHDNLDLLPLMTYVYMVEKATQAQLEKVCRQIGVEFDERVLKFLRGVADEDESDGVVTFRRRAPVLRMPRNAGGLALKDRFLQHEIGQSMTKPDSSEFFVPGGTFRYSRMMSIPAEALDKVQQRIADLITEVEVAENSGNQLENPSSQPYFFALVISGRPEYDGRSPRGEDE